MVNSYRIPLVPYLICMFCLAMIVSPAVVLLESHSNSITDYIGERIGSAAFLFSVAALISIPWRLIERMFSASSNRPLFVGLLAFAVAAYLCFKGNASGQTSIGPYVYDACEFDVVFPQEPAIKFLSISRGGKDIKYDQASYEGEREYLRAECTPIVVSKEDVLNTLKSQAVADGLSGVGYEETSDQYIEMRGYKKVSGKNATYIVRMFFEPHNALVLMGASLSADFPTDGIKRFFASVKVVR